MTDPGNKNFTEAAPNILDQNKITRLSIPENVYVTVAGRPIPLREALGDVATEIRYQRLNQNELGLMQAVIQLMQPGLSNAAQNTRHLPSLVTSVSKSAEIVRRQQLSASPYRATQNALGILNRRNLLDPDVKIQLESHKGAKVAVSPFLDYGEAYPEYDEAGIIRQLVINNVHALTNTMDADGDAISNLTLASKFKKGIHVETWASVSKFPVFAPFITKLMTKADYQEKVGGRTFAALGGMNATRFKQMHHVTLADLLGFKGADFEGAAGQAEFQSLIKGLNPADIQDKLINKILSGEGGQVGLSSRAINNAFNMNDWILARRSGEQAKIDILEKELRKAIAKGLPTSNVIGSEKNLLTYLERSAAETLASKIYSDLKIGEVERLNDLIQIQESNLKNLIPIGDAEALRHFKEEGILDRAGHGINRNFVREIGGKTYLDKNLLEMRIGGAVRRLKSLAKADDGQDIAATGTSEAMVSLERLIKAKKVSQASSSTSKATPLFGAAVKPKSMDQLGLAFLANMSPGAPSLTTPGIAHRPVYQPNDPVEEINAFYDKSGPNAGAKIKDLENYLFKKRYARETSTGIEYFSILEMHQIGTNAQRAKFGMPGEGNQYAALVVRGIDGMALPIGGGSTTNDGRRISTMAVIPVIDPQTGRLIQPNSSEYRKILLAHESIDNFNVRAGKEANRRIGELAEAGFLSLGELKNPGSYSNKTLARSSNRGEAYIAALAAEAEINPEKKAILLGLVYGHDVQNNSSSISSFLTRLDQHMSSAGFETFVTLAPGVKTSGYSGMAFIDDEQANTLFKWTSMPITKRSRDGKMYQSLILNQIEQAMENLQFPGGLGGFVHEGQEGSETYKLFRGLGGLGAAQAEAKIGKQAINAVGLNDMRLVLFSPEQLDPRILHQDAVDEQAVDPSAEAAYLNAAGVDYLKERVGSKGSWFRGYRDAVLDSTGQPIPSELAAGAKRVRTGASGEFKWVVPRNLDEFNTMPKILSGTSGKNTTQALASLGIEASSKSGNPLMFLSTGGLKDNLELVKIQAAEADRIAASNNLQGGFSARLQQILTKKDQLVRETVNRTGRAELPEGEAKSFYLQFSSFMDDLKAFGAQYGNEEIELKFKDQIKKLRVISISANLRASMVSSELSKPSRLSNDAPDFYEGIQNLQFSLAAAEDLLGKLVPEISGDVVKTMVAEGQILDQNSLQGYMQTSLKLNTAITQAMQASQATKQIRNQKAFGRGFHGNLVGLWDVLESSNADDRIANQLRNVAGFLLKKDL